MIGYSGVNMIQFDGVNFIAQFSFKPLNKSTRLIRRIVREPVAQAGTGSCRHPDNGLHYTSGYYLTI